MKPCDNCQKPTTHNYSGFYFCDHCVYPEYENTYMKARNFASFSQKYGHEVDPDMMTKNELITWYKKSLSYDAY